MRTIIPFKWNKNIFTIFEMHSFFVKRRKIMDTSAPKPCRPSKLIATAALSGLSSLISFCCSTVCKTQLIGF